MIFNDHSKLIGEHAFLSPSNYHWLNYDVEKLIRVYTNKQAAELGTELHDFAAKAIKLGQKLPKSKKTLNSYVNDAIGFKMVPEQVLYFSNFCYGTADAISFKNNLLRIHDLKTGVSPVSMNQLMIYAALFCLEYGFDPKDINAELRIYQNDEIIICQPTNEQIDSIMDKIVTFDKALNDLYKGE